MFINSHYSQNGFDNIEEIILNLKQNNINHVCLLEQNGISIPMFLELCRKYKMDFLIGYSFSCYLKEEQAKGYLVVNTLTGMKLVNQIVEELREDFIPQITQKHILQLEENKVFLFVKQKDAQHKEYFSGDIVEIKGISYLNKETEKLHNKIKGKQVAYNLEDYCFKHKWIIKNSTNLTHFMKSSLPIKEEKMILEMKRDRIKRLNREEMKRLKFEIEIFSGKKITPLVEMLFALQKENISFELKGEATESLLLYTYGFVGRKPILSEKSKRMLCNLDKIEISVLKSDEYRAEKFLKQKFKTKHPFSYLTLSGKKALIKARKIMNEDLGWIENEIQENETIEEFEKRMRFYILSNKKTKEVVEVAKKIEKTYSEKVKIKNEYYIHPKTIEVFGKEETVVYLEASKLHLLNIPYLKIKKTQA